MDPLQDYIQSLNPVESDTTEGLFYGAKYNCYKKGEFIGIFTWTQDKYVGDSFQRPDLTTEGETCIEVGLPDICRKDIHKGDIVTFTDFRGVHTTAQSKHDGYIPGWVGVIRWSDYDGWVLDKNNTHNQSILKAKDGEKQSRNNPYHHRMGHISRVRPMIVGNMYENIDLLAHFDYDAVKEKYEKAVEQIK